MQKIRVTKDAEGKPLTREGDILKRWQEYFEKLMNEENDHKKRTDLATGTMREVPRVNMGEVRNAMKKMKNGKAVGPDKIPVEAWKCLGEAAVDFLTRLFNKILQSGEMPKEWRYSTLIPIFKGKGDAQCCSNYRGIKLMSHSMKMWERVIEGRLRQEVQISQQPYGFMPGKSTMDAIFALRMMIEKYREGQKELHCVFIDLEKAYDRVPRLELWHCMKQAGVTEKYIRVVQNMYAGCEIVARCAAGLTKPFKVRVGLHQGSALSPLLFAVVMDQLTGEVRNEPP